jgi:Glycosyl hydrolase family 9
MAACMCRATPKGLRSFKDENWASLRMAVTASALAGTYAAMPGISPQIPDFARCFVRSQLGYVAGDTGFSYVVGHGDAFPKQVHHRDACCTLAEDAAGDCGGEKCAPGPPCTHHTSVEKYCRAYQCPPLAHSAPAHMPHAHMHRLHRWHHSPEYAPASDAYVLRQRWHRTKEHALFSDACAVNSERCAAAASRSHSGGTEPTRMSSQEPWSGVPTSTTSSLTSARSTITPRLLSITMLASLQRSQHWLPPHRTCGT